MLNIDENEFKNNIAQKIKSYRKDTQEKTAEKALISVDTLSSIERGLNVPSSLNLVNLCNALNVTPNDILEDFIFNKDKLLISKFNLQFNDLSTEDKAFIIQAIEYLNKRKI